jgi:adenylate kinase
MNIIILGPQGSGKGTQAVRIAERYKLKHISTGDIFRENVKNETELGKKVQKIMNDGAFVPDEITNAIVKDTLQKVKKNFILDGYPRTLKQAEYLARVIEIDVAINLNISDEDAVKRIASRRVCSKCGAGFNVLTLKPKKEGICDKCGGKLIQREDDKPEAIKKRLGEYHSNTEPILGFYEEQGTLLTFDGMKPINDVLNEIISELDDRMN